MNREKKEEETENRVEEDKDEVENRKMLPAFTQKNVEEHS